MRSGKAGYDCFTPRADRPGPGTRADISPLEVSKVNAAFLMLTSAWLAGADPAPPAAQAAPAAPAVVATGNSCGGCGATCGDSCGDPCCENGRRKLLGGLFGRLKGRFHRANDCCEETCAPASNPCPAPCPPKPVCCQAAPTTSCDPCADPCSDGGRKKLLGGLAGKLRSKFHRGGDCCGSVDACGCGSVTPAPAAPAAPAKPEAEPKKMPTTIGSGSIKTQEGIPNPFESSRRYVEKFAASPDYSRLTGQLFFVNIDGGRWVLRYAPISMEDRFGGSVILSRDSNISGFQEGDVISVEGEILSEKSDLRLGAAHFRARRAELVERRPSANQE